VFLGFVLNASKEAEWASSIVKFSWLINLYILIFTFQALKIETVQIIKVLSVGTLLPTVYSLASYVHGLDLMTGRLNDRITGLVNSATYHAHGNAMVFVFLVGSLCFSWRLLSRKWRIFAQVSAFLLGVSILLTFTRGIWISLLAVSATMTLFFFGFKRFVQVLVAAGLAFGLFINYWPKFNERVQNTNVTYNHERLDLFKVNVQIWKEYPWLAIGYGENSRRLREYWDRPEWHQPPGYIISHAHNQFLNVLSTTGILGEVFFLCFYLFFIFKNFWMIRKTSRKETPERFKLLVVCLWAQLEFLVACCSDVGFEYAKIRALILLVWALVIAIDQKPSLVKETAHV
jgi:O-antigen ligase